MSFLTLSGLCQCRKPLLSSSGNLGRLQSSHFLCLPSPFPALGFHFPNKEAALDSLLQFPEPVARSTCCACPCVQWREINRAVMIETAMLVRHTAAPEGDFQAERQSVSGHCSHPGWQPLNGFLDRTTSCEMVTLWSISEAVGLGCSYNMSRHGGLDYRHWFLTHTKAGKSKIMMSADLALLRKKALFVACRWTPSHCVLTEEEGRKGEGRENDLASPFL